MLSAIVGCESISVGEIAEKCNLSIPTASKFIDELVESGIIIDLGQRHKQGGRKPNMYAPNPAIGYFVGVDLRNHTAQIGVMDFGGNLIFKSDRFAFGLERSNAFNHICTAIDTELKNSGIDPQDIIAYTFSVPGRVNTNTGESFNYFTEVKGSLREAFKERLGAEVYIDNDSRVMCYGEYVHSKLADFSNMLYINLSWGLGMGMILDGKLYYDHTGFSGELGHIPIFDNEIFCRCGKKGCLETEASGNAMLRILQIKHAAGAQSVLSPKIERNEKITTQDFIDAVDSGDMLMIEILEEVGTSLGKGIAAMINVLNPQLVVLGGALAQTEDYLLMSTLSSVRKHSINIVNRETTFRLAATGNDVDILGCCYIARDKTLQIL